jgi:hypothetical protein
MEKLRILIADDLLQSREDFIEYWHRIFSKQYQAEFIECETAYEALNMLDLSVLDNKYFDIVVSDVDFSENTEHEDRIAGLDIITKAKDINFDTITIWYSAQKEEDAIRFKTEEDLKRRRYIDFSLKKAYLGDHFKPIMSSCMELIRKNKINLGIFLSKLFDTYNYGEDENHDLGFYKLTHSNYSYAEKLKVLQKAKNYYEESDVKSFLFTESTEKIDKYLLNLESADPTPAEMEKFKAAFRLELSDEILKECQQPLVVKNIYIENRIESNAVRRIYCERERILLGFKTIYENIAKHNFAGNITGAKIITTVVHESDHIILTIFANGNSFNPQEKFQNNRTSGLAAIYECFNKYCDVVFDGNGICYNIFTNAASVSKLAEGLNITISIPLPSLTTLGGIIEDV